MAAETASMEFHGHVVLGLTALAATAAALVMQAFGLITQKQRLVSRGLSAFVAVALVSIPALLWCASHRPPGTELAALAGDAVSAATAGLIAAAAAALAALSMVHRTRRLPSYFATAALILGLGASVLVGHCVILGLSCELRTAVVAAGEVAATR